MRTEDFSKPEDVLEWLSDPIRSIREGLDHGLSLAETKMEDLPAEPHLRAHLIRVGALMHLRDHPGEHWSIGRRLPLSGVEVTRDPFTMRVLCSQRGNPPSPGRSLARQRYWCQLSLFSDTEPITVGANLILDWSLDEDQRLVLALSKPVGVWPYEGKPRLEWRRAITEEAGRGLRFAPADDNDIDFDLTEIEERDTDDWGANSAGA